MSTAYRELSIIYGVVIAGGVNRQVRLNGRYKLSRGADDGSVTFEILVVNQTQAGFVDLCQLVEANYRKPYQSLSINLGGAPITTGSQGLSSYLDPKPEIEKVGEIGDTGRSRRYLVTIRFGMPADNVTTKGFRDLDIDVATEESGRRTMRISGLVTALGSQDARKVYEGKIDGIATTAASAVSISDFEIIGEPSAESSRNAKTLEFERVYREIIFTQGGGSSLDNPNIVEQQISLTKSFDAPGDSNGPLYGGSGASTTAKLVNRLSRIRLEYSADTKGKTPEEIYDQIRDWLIRQVKDQTDGTMALVLEQPQFGPLDDNRLSVTMEALAVVEGSTIFERSITGITTGDNLDEIIYAHDGTRHGAYVYPSKGQVTRKIIEVTRWAEKVSYSKAMTRADNHFKDLKGTATFDGEAGSWSRPRIVVARRPSTLGRGGNLIAGTDVTVVVESQFFAEAKKTATQSQTRARV